jgi:hypothetical protein
MKILILALPRTGSTSLLAKIEQQNYKGIFEPYSVPQIRKFNYEYPLKELKENNRIVVKQIFANVWNTQEPVELYQYPLHLHNPTLYAEQQIEFSKHFDRVILLDRKDTKEHLESYINVIYKQSQNKSVFERWQKKDLPQEFIDNHLLENDHFHFYIQKSEILLVSKKLNIDITWYEDLYGEDRNKSLEIIKSWNLDIDEELLNEDLHPRNKYLIKSKNII